MVHEPAYIVTGADRPGRWVITVDHARNRVPDWVNGGDLGLPADDMNRHIAFDIGAEGAALALGQLLDSPVICSNFSRLVVDPNRGDDDPTLVMQLYDGTIIPANRGVSTADRNRRVAELYRPYHDAYEELLAGRQDPVVLAVHSFTPQLKGRPHRPWEIGILHAGDTRLSDPLLESLREGGNLCVGENEPYIGYLPGDSVDQHALRCNRLNALVEIRNDLIETPAGQQAWAGRLVPHLLHALANRKDG